MDNEDNDYYCNFSSNPNANFMNTCNLAIEVIQDDFS